MQLTYDTKKVLTIIGMMLGGAVIAYAFTPKGKKEIGKVAGGNTGGSGGFPTPEDLEDPIGNLGWKEDPNTGIPMPPSWNFGPTTNTGGTPVTNGSDGKCPCPPGFIWQQGNVCSNNTTGYINEGLAIMRFAGGNIEITRAGTDSGFDNVYGKESCDKWEGTWNSQKQSCTIKVPQGFDARIVSTNDTVHGNREYSYDLFCKK